MKRFSYITVTPGKAVVQPNRVLNDRYRETVTVRLRVSYGGPAYLAPVKATQPLERTDDLIVSVTGQDARYFCPPGGHFSPQVLAVAKSLGLTTAS